MTFITSSDVRPWIVELLESYGKTEGRLRPVQAQVTEFGDLADYTQEGKEVAAALVNISDHEFYIPAVVTWQAKQLLEDEEDHYDLGDLKNKDIVLREYRVAFQDAAEESKCEFFIVIENFRMLPIERQTANVCSCKTAPSVQRKISTLWLSRVRKDDMNSTSYSDAPLTQMMEYFQQRGIERLFNIAMECLNLAAPSPEPSTSRAAPPIPGLGLTGWRAERREHRDRSPYSLSTAHLIIPPKQREILDNIPEWRDDYVPTVDTEGASGFEEQAVLCLTISSESESEPDEQTHAVTPHDPWSEHPSMDISFSSAGTESHASPPEAQNKEEGVQAAALHSSTPASLKLPAALPRSDSLPSQLGTQQAESYDPTNTLQLFTDSSSCIWEPAKKMAAVASGQRVLEHESVEASITSYRKARHTNVSPRCSSSMLPSSSAQALGGSLPGTAVIPRDRSVRRSLVDCWSPSLAASSSDEELVLRSKPAKRKCQVVDSDSEEIIFNTDDEDVVRAPEIVKPKRKQVQLKPCLTFLNAEKAAKNTITAGKAAKNTVTAGKAAKNTVTAGKAAKKTVTGGKAALGAVAESCKEQTVTNQQVSKTSNKNRSTSRAGDLQKPALKHRDGTSFMYSYEPPSAELAKRINSLRVPDSLLLWAWQYTSKPD
ncbi:uncharacterized protein LOC121296186 [Polyodon spathula]|uniref:uncharacterized protein LOC121296186 n=1 Tax=Polyodon spathula TaxID=7913 RepID=UPI001B7E0D84|nr:uncharacterized protein LOC121296186 [Polyodon spathula]XP_041077395.1 uncharacterized protein LOC121296186 [Polyodon spathula]XP_041077396.1 uncharacterized protein LOC121296186 [Polyodon spathula]